LHYFFFALSDQISSNLAMASYLKTGLTVFEGLVQNYCEGVTIVLHQALDMSKMPFFKRCLPCQTLIKAVFIS